MESLDQTQILLLLVTVAAVSFLLGRQSTRGAPTADQAERDMRMQQLAEDSFSAMAPSIQQEIDQLITDGRTIEAVKLIRENSGLGLREAKIVVDHRGRLLKGA